MRNLRHSKKGQFSVIAALLVSVILIMSVISMYSMVRYTPLNDSPKVLTGIGEMNTDIKRILDFTVGYYGSILRVTGNSTYAKNLTSSYLSSGLVNIARSHPEWNPSFELDFKEISTCWFMPKSYSTGNLSVTYSLSTLGIEGVTYKTSSALTVEMLDPDSPDEAKIKVTRDNSEPELGLTKDNFYFYNYSYAESTWMLVNPTNVIISANGVYTIAIPEGINNDSYSVQVEDNRGIIVPAFYSPQSIEDSGVPHYTYTFDWNSDGMGNIYDTLDTDTFAIELLQNGTLKWLGQSLEVTPKENPIPPVCIKAFRVNATIGENSQQIPFQVEDWASNYMVPLGLAGNDSLFSNTNMLVFLVNSSVSNVTVWWDGNDTAVQTHYAWQNIYFNDSPENGVLKTDDLALLLNKEYLYANNFDWSNSQWSHPGSSPFIDNTDSSYIFSHYDNYMMGWFGFQDLTGSHATDAAAEYIQLQFQCNTENYGDDYFEFWIDDGSQIHGPISVDNLHSYSEWKTVDISDYIDNLEEINNLKIRIGYVRNGYGSSNVYIYRVRALMDFWVTSVAENSATKADLLRINGENPVYGADPAYVIYNGIVRDIVQQEAEYGSDDGSSGVPNCPNLYSQIVLTFPATSSYYTYSLRTIFVTDVARTLTDLSVLQLSVYTVGSLTGECVTEDGVQTGLPVVSYSEGNYDSSPWAHHWSEFITSANGGGVMFTDNSNTKLYAFDAFTPSVGGLYVDKQESDTRGYIEVNPVNVPSAQFSTPLDLSWQGAVVAFDDEPIYPESGNVGLWVMVEHPPAVSID